MVPSKRCFRYTEAVISSLNAQRNVIKCDDVYKYVRFLIKRRVLSLQLSHKRICVMRNGFNKRV